MIITGNVQVARDHLSLGRDLWITQSNVKEFAALSHAIKHSGNSQESDSRPLAILQLNHTGRQSPRFVGGRWPSVPPLGPSGKRVGSDSQEGFVARVCYSLLFQTPLAASRSSIQEVLDQFVESALRSLEAGFDGVQIHASHGCEY